MSYDMTSSSMALTNCLRQFYCPSESTYFDNLARSQEGFPSITTQSLEILLDSKQVAERRDPGQPGAETRLEIRDVVEVPIPGERYESQDLSANKIAQDSDRLPEID